MNAIMMNARPNKMKRTAIVTRKQLPSIVHMFSLSTIEFMHSAPSSSPDSNLLRACMKWKAQWYQS